MKPKRLVKFFAVTTMSFVLVGCSITAQEARDIGMAAVDAACDNLPGVSVTFEQNVAAGKIVGTRVRVGRDALAIINSTCSTRPITNAASAMRTISSALFALAQAEVTQASGGNQ